MKKLSVYIIAIPSIIKRELSIMKTIYFIRHGQTQYNQEGKFIGFTDLPLSLKGREKIKTLWEANKPKVDMIFSSPLKRCIEN